MRALMLFSGALLLAGMGSRATAADEHLDPTKDRFFGAKLVQCAICHGAQGMPKPSSFPIIFGQQESYLGKQLRDYHSGERKSEVMEWVSEKLSPLEQASAAAILSKRKWPTRTTGTPPLPAPRGIDACRACHEANFLGAPSAPRLAGQNYEYLAETMRQFAENERKGSVMTQMMKSISASERDAMARYLSSL